MPGFVLHPAAYTDLDEIWEYIATDNLDWGIRSKVNAIPV
jgi:plasmid stabilization system protein ParE